MQFLVHFLTWCVSQSLFKIIAVLIIIKAILKLTTAWNRSPTCLIGKTAIVTGASSGIGFYTALDFAKRGARVILVCNNSKQAEEAKERIITETGNTNIVVKFVELSSLDSVREFVKNIKNSEERLDILVNNAGAGYLDNIKTEDGLSLLMQVNYFGPFLLTHLLIDLLKKSTPSRIVNVASIAAHYAKLDVNDLNAFQSNNFFGKLQDYANSKLLIILFTNQLAKKLEGTGVTVNSLHPGAIDSNFYVNFPRIIQQLLPILTKSFFKTPEEGTQTTLYVSLSKDLEGVSGGYFENCKNVSHSDMPRIAKDEDLANRVYEISEDLVKLTKDEQIFR